MRLVFLVTFILVSTFSLPSLAGFGGSRSSGGSRSYSSPSRSSSSSFGGSRSRSSGVTITRPSAPSSSYSSPVINHTTVIQHDSGSGFWTGMMVSSLFNRQPQAVVVDGQPGQAVVVQEGHGFFYYLIVTIAIGVTVAVLVGVFSAV